MKLAEALIARSDLQKNIAQLRIRMEQNVKVQEGESPAESIDELLELYHRLVPELTILVQKINRTNSVTRFGSGTLSDAIAERDGLISKINTYRELYEAASIRQERYSRSEVKYIRCIDTSKLQKEIDAMSKQYRVLDTQIQSANWTTELAD